jgi:transposase, IS5 family
MLEAGMKVSSGTIVDATIINASSSTKNASGERDPEMHQTKKGNQWFFGMKGHVGVDNKPSSFTRWQRAPPTYATQPASRAASWQETHVWVDGAYAGQSEMIEALAPAAKDLTQKRGRGYK